MGCLVGLAQTDGRPSDTDRPLALNEGREPPTVKAALQKTYLDRVVSAMTSRVFARLIHGGDDDGRATVKLQSSAWQKAKVIDTLNH